MTGLWIISDLHIDTAPFTLPPTPAGAEVIVIAGDVADGHHRSIRWLQQHAVPTGLPVIFVCGNHDYFAGDLADDCAEYYSAIGVTLLHAQRPAVEINGVRFVGSTLWTDYNVAGDVPAAMAVAKGLMPDFWNIDVGMRRARPADLLSAHQLQLAVIESELSWRSPGPTVVVTHHAPHPGSLLGGVVSGSSDASWASDLSAVIESWQPDLWVHGHVHNSCDYTVEPGGAVMSFSQERHNAGGTRVVCNPRGYATPRDDGKRPGNPEFLTDWVIET